MFCPCDADHDVNRFWLIHFYSWNTVLLAIVGILGCIVSVQELSSKSQRAASPRKAGTLRNRSKWSNAGKDPNEVVGCRANNTLSLGSTLEMPLHWHVAVMCV